MSLSNQSDRNSIKPYQSDGMDLIAQINPSYMYVFKKLEKIVSAIFVVTNLFLETDVLKNQLRQVGMDALSVVAHAQMREKESQNLVPFLLETTALLDIAFHSGLISEMNHTVLSRECSQLIGHIQSHSTPNEHVLSESFFKTEEYLKQRAISQTHQTSKPSDVVHNSYRPKQQTQKSKQHQQKTISRSDTFQKNGRRQKILVLIKDKKNVSVSDISKEITDCSEKTIQRELVSMVEQGILEKHGERRWSTYSFR